MENHEQSLMDGIGVAILCEGNVYISNKKETSLKVGQKFKKGAILAKNPQYFKDNDDGSVSLVPGRLSKVAVASGDYTSIFGALY